MTFFKVNDPKNRELIKEIIAKRSIIREADRRRKMGEAFEFEQLSQFFKPITKEAEKIEKGVRGLPGEIAKILPQPINIQMPQQPPPPQQRQPRRRRRQQSPPPQVTSPPPTPPPTPPPQQRQTRRQRRRQRQQSPPQSPTPEQPNEEEEEDYYNIGSKFKPPYIKDTKDGYKFGNFPIRFKTNEIEINGQGYFEHFTDSYKIYDIFTNKNSRQTWDDLNEEEKRRLGYVTVHSDVFYDPNTGKKKNKIGNNFQWNNVFSHIWHNRFSYMTNDMLNSERTESEVIKNIGKSSDKKETRETKQILIKILENIREKMKKENPGKGLKGSGPKKNYVTLPSDPSELVDRLTLLSGSKDAGNTGVYNEMVSICDELLKRKIIGKGQYKQFLSNI